MNGGPCMCTVYTIHTHSHTRTHIHAYMDWNRSSCWDSKQQLHLGPDSFVDEIRGGSVGAMKLLQLLLCYARYLLVFSLQLKAFVYIMIMSIWLTVGQAASPINTGNSIDPSSHR